MYSDTESDNYSKVIERPSVSFKSSTNHITASASAKRVAFEPSTRETHATSTRDGESNAIWTPNARNSTSWVNNITFKTPSQFGEDSNDKWRSKTSPMKRMKRLRKRNLQDLDPLTPPGAVTTTWQPDFSERLTRNFNAVQQNGEPTSKTTAEGAEALIDTRASSAKERTASTDQLAVGSGRRTTFSTPHGKHVETKKRNFVSETEENQRPFKRIKSSAVQVQPVVDLAKLAPQPIQVSYKVHPLEDRSDAWFIEMFRRLFHQVDMLTSHYFGVHDLNQGEFFQPWALEMTPEFIAWAEKVAEPDPNTGGWDELLRDTQQRKWFIMAILVKILQVKVFDDDLWGANESEKKLLHELDVALIDREGKYTPPTTVRGFGTNISSGFQRTALRAEMVRSIISRSAVTKNFYQETAILTAQISLLLKPLSDYLYRIPPRQGQKLPLITSQYQSIHNLVSTAAYLSICVRLSPTIFYFYDVAPGSTYDRNEQYSLEQGSFNKSRAIVMQTYKSECATWTTEREIAQKELKAFKKHGKEHGREGRKASRRLSEILEHPPTAPGKYAVLTKIGVWPKITRFKPGDDKDDDAGCSKYLLDKDGFRILEMGKAAVVCYYGVSEKGVDSAKVELRDWIKEKQRRFGAKEGNGLVTGAALAVGTTLVAMAWANLGVEVQASIAARLSDAIGILRS